MRDDDAAGREDGRQDAQAAGDEFIGKTVKTVAANSFVVIAAWQREGVGDKGVAAMKRRIETGDLNGARKCALSCFYSGNIVRLMQGSEWDENLELGENVLLDDRRLHEIDAAMHDAMADGDDPLVAMSVLEPIENGSDRGGVINPAAAFIDCECDLASHGRAHGESRFGAEPLDLPGGKLFHSSIAQQKGGEFDRRGTRVQRENNSCHYTHSAARAARACPLYGRPSRRQKS